MYSILKFFLFKMDAEQAHHFTFRLIRFAFRYLGASVWMPSLYAGKKWNQPVTVAGITFPNRVGLAAGFDKDAVLYKELGALGFGFVELGTLTPVGQPGNDKPRLFRLLDDEAIVNRMGFNNKGAEDAVDRLKKRDGNLIIGGNIGKNKVTPNENAVDDYLKCFHALDNHVDYFVVNVSSPNTPGLRDLQEKEPLTKLLKTLKAEAVKSEKVKPIFLKIAPDLTDSQLDDIIEIVTESDIAGVIATNTTIDRSGLKSSNAETVGAGGLSGKPLTKRSTEVVRYLKQHQTNNFAIIGVGGIMSGKDAKEKIDAGADLVQLYSGFIFRGPALIKEVKQHLFK